jgi:2-polyprenyl-3-methyl-5-hydroxy-6-metoxy-1,4-benzoquinol methylase
LIEPDWKSQFYDAYVSSGQATDTGESAADLFRPRESYLKHLIAQHVPPDKNLAIVDLACGPGAMLYFLNLAGYRNIAGVDISQEQIDVAARIGISTASCATLEDYLAALTPATVDVILAIDIFEHLTRPHVMEMLKAIRRVLRPGGRCVAHVPNGEGLSGMKIRFGDFTHELAFTRTSASQIFNVAGFSQVRCFEDKPRVHGAKSLARRIIWDIGTVPTRIIRAAEEGCFGAILSQNLTIEAIV